MYKLVVGKCFWSNERRLVCWW